MGRKQWAPSKDDYEKAYITSCSPGATDVDICKALGIRLGVYRKWKSDFIVYFKQRENQNKRKKNRQYDYRTGSGRPKGSRKLTPGMRAKILTLAEHEIPAWQIAKMCGVCRATIFNWKKAIPKFKDEMDLAAKVASLHVKQSLVKRANGMYLNDEQTVDLYDRNDNLISRQKTKRRKQIPPSVQAQQFFLINKDNWSKDSERTKVNNQGTILDALSKMTGKVDEGENEQFEEWDDELD